MGYQNMFTTVLYLCILANTETTIPPGYFRKWQHQMSEQFALQQNRGRGQASRRIPTLRELRAPQVEVTPNHEHFGYSRKPIANNEPPVSVGKPQIITPKQPNTDQTMQFGVTNQRPTIFDFRPSKILPKQFNNQKEKERKHSNSHPNREFEKEGKGSRHQNNGVFIGDRNKRPGNLHLTESEDFHLLHPEIPQFVYDKYRLSKKRNFGMCNPTSPSGMEQMLVNLKQLFPNKFMSEAKMRAVVTENRNKLKSRQGHIRQNHQLKIKDISDREFAFQVSSDTVDLTPPDQPMNRNIPIPPGMRCEPECCDTFRFHMHYKSITVANQVYPLVNLENEYQFIHVGECPEQSNCTFGRCFQHYSTQYVLVWNVTMDYWPPIDIVAHEFPSHCQWVNT